MKRRAGEFELIDAFVRAFGAPPAPYGPGDDCAVLPAAGQSCVTTDAIVEAVHFTRRHYALEDVGHKALAVNLSDLAAMGARPAWFLCAVAMPRRFGLTEVRALARGMAKLARRHRVRLVGGNFTSADRLAITITAAGSARKPLLRSGARAGDLLYASGKLGGARAALRRGRPLTRPEPQIALGLAAAPYASACIDVSDGLAADLAHICRASHVGAVVNVDAIPRPAGVSAADALAGGEDYELLFAVRPRRAGPFEAAARRAGQRVTPIGHFTGRSLILQAAGRRIEPPPGFDHFR